MKYIFLGSNSDISKEFITKSNPTDEIITISRNSPSDIKINWENGYKEFEVEDFEKLNNWDVLISFIGSQDPIGPIESLDPFEIIKGVNVNFTFQFAALANLLRFRRKNSFNKLILFAGAGTNNAPKNYSVYITSKIALIKLTELIDSECENIHATIVGPGWVKTKIHNSTLNQDRDLAPESYDETKRRFRANEFNDISLIIDCIKVILKEKSEAFSGRNISAQYDKWKDKDFKKKLIEDKNIYKLRRII